MEVILTQYVLVEVISLSLIPPTKIKKVIVNLDTLTNLSKDSNINQNKLEIIWPDPIGLKLKTSKSFK